MPYKIVGDEIQNADGETFIKAAPEGLMMLLIAYLNAYEKSIDDRRVLLTAAKSGNLNMISDAIKIVEGE